MKKAILVLTCLGFSMFLKSQVNADEIALLQANYGLEKRDIVKEAMRLNKEEEKGFWQMYDAYEEERKSIGKKRLQNLSEYAKNYDNLTEAKVKELINNSLDVQAALVKLWKKTYDDASKVMSPIRAGFFIQLEIYLENAIRDDIMDEIPTIDDLERKKRR